MSPTPAKERIIPMQTYLKLKKLIAYTTVTSLMWGDILWAWPPDIIEDRIDEITIVRKLGLPSTFLESGDALHITGLLQSTDNDIFIRTKGDIYLDKIIAAGNLYIETPGRVFFKNFTKILGTVQIRAKDTEVADIFNTDKGATLHLDTLTLANKGVFSAHGLGLQGAIAKLINNGKIDLSQAQVKIDDGYNRKNSVLRTRGHFILDGNTFENQGVIFTLGVHQANLKTSYVDSGLFFNPTLLLLNASSIVSSHSSLISDRRNSYSIEAFGYSK